MKDNCKSVCLDSGIDIEKVHGHMDLVLTNVKTGKVEEVHEDNLITNAIRDYFANCGFLNYPNLDKNTLVEQLLGGVMLFDDNISEDATIIHAPAGLHMIANAAQGYTNNVPNVEQGTATANDGSTGTVYNGWQPDGSYLHTYEWNTTQGNGTIACVCLAGCEYAWVGEGNSVSNTRHATKANYIGLRGARYEQTGFSGVPFNVNLSDSSCNTWAIETRTDPQTEEEYITGVLRKYRLPISKLNVKGKLTAPVLISETEIVIDADMQSAGMMYEWDGRYLRAWNVQALGSSYADLVEWGNGWTQYLWNISPNGTITKSTIVNTSDDTLYGLQAAHFDGGYCFFLKTNQRELDGYISSTKIYILNLTTGVITGVDNPNGATAVHPMWWTSLYQCGWVLHHGTGDGKIFTSSNNGSVYGFVVDAVNKTVYVHNGSNISYDRNVEWGSSPTASPLVRYTGLNNRDVGYLNLYRDQSYIGSINNLANPVYKTSEKTMKLTYRITFDEE